MAPSLQWGLVGGPRPRHTCARPSAPPLCQPSEVTLEQKPRAGIGKCGTVKPPAGTTPACLQFASLAPMSIMVTTPSGKVKGAKVATDSDPSLTQVPPPVQPVLSKHVVVVALLQCPVLRVVTRCAAQHEGSVVLVVVT